MTDWIKQGFGPGTDVCCRCKGAKAAGRRPSKWCATCADEMKSRRATGALDTPVTGARARRNARIVR